MPPDFIYPTVRKFQRINHILHTLRQHLFFRTIKARIIIVAPINVAVATAIGCSVIVAITNETDRNTYIHRDIQTPRAKQTRNLLPSIGSISKTVGCGPNFIGTGCSGSHLRRMSNLRISSPTSTAGLPSVGSKSRYTGTVDSTINRIFCGYSSSLFANSRK